MSKRVLSTAFMAATALIVSLCYSPSNEAMVSSRDRISGLAEMHQSAGAIPPEDETIRNTEECSISIGSDKPEPNRRPRRLLITIGGCSDLDAISTAYRFGSVQMSKLPFGETLKKPSQEVFSSFLNGKSIRSSLAKRNNGVSKLVATYKDLEWTGTSSSSFYPVQYDDIGPGEFYVWVVFEGKDESIPNLVSNQIKVRL